jgi:hypothetical protein
MKTKSPDVVFHADEAANRNNSKNWEMWTLTVPQTSPNYWTNEKPFTQLLTLCYESGLVALNGSVRTMFQLIRPSTSNCWSPMREGYQRPGAILHEGMIFLVHRSFDDGSCQVRLIFWRKFRSKFLRLWHSAWVTWCSRWELVAGTKTFVSWKRRFGGVVVNWCIVSWEFIKDDITADLQSASDNP